MEQIKKEKVCTVIKYCPKCEMTHKMPVIRKKTITDTWGKKAEYIEAYFYCEKYKFKVDSLSRIVE